jgi:uncharacterized Tic20 family protein
MSQSTTAVLSSAAAFTAHPAAALPAGYVETDPVQRGEAKMAHLLGIFGIVGTGIYYLVKRSDAGEFVNDQMKEAFNFHLFAFVAAITFSIVGAVATAVIGLLGLVVSLGGTAVMITALVLSIVNAIKAGKGTVARYPARLRVLK